MIIFVCDRVENLKVEKGENAASQHFFLFPPFSIAFRFIINIQNCVVKGKNKNTPQRI